MAKRILAIDDERPCKGANIVARTYEDGLKALELGPWDELWLDHDLGAVEQQKIKGREATGYDILCFMEQVFPPSKLPKKILLLTSNASARPKMEAAIERLYQSDYFTKKEE
jgi:hypothetical protein